MLVIKNHLVAFLGEFIGTFLFLFFAFGGTQTAALASRLSDTDVPNVSQLTFVSLVFGFSLAVNVWVFFRVSGGLFNPAVTLALVLVGVVDAVRGIFIFVAQITASIAAAGAVKGLTPMNKINFTVGLSNGISKTQGMFLEMFFTLLLVFTILMLAAEKQKSTFIAPVGIGLALFVAELFGVFWTGGAVNPARAFGPAVVDRFDSYHWIYWLGPLLGALLAALIYKVFKFLNYEDVNGTQDLTPMEEEEIEKEEKRKRQQRRRHSGHSGQGSRGYHSDRDDIERADRSSVASRHGKGSVHAPVPEQSRRSGHYSQPPMQYDYDGKPIEQDTSGQGGPMSSTYPPIVYQQQPSAGHSHRSSRESRRAAQI